MRFHKATTLIGVTAAVTAAATAAPQQRLLVPESTNDVIMEFDPMTGALINAVAIDLDTVVGGAAGTPIEVVQAPNGDLLVSDQSDFVFRLSSDGTTFLGMATTPLDNVRGLDLRGDNALVSNSGSINGAPGDALVEIDPSGALVGSTPTGDPFDVTAYTMGGTPGFLVSDIAGEDIVFADGSDLTIQTVFHDSDGVSGIDFPEQISIKTSNGNVLAAGFSAPSGIYEYDSNGDQVNYIDTGAIGGQSGLRGVVELGNGNLLFTNGSGVHIYDVTAGTISTEITGVSARFASIIGGGSGTIGTNYCTAVPNSTGGAASISAAGSTVAANNDLTLTAVGMPAQQFGIFVTSETQGSTPVAAGNLCVAGTIVRFQEPGQILQADANGEFSLQIDITALPAGVPTPIMPGETWNFTAWFRDIDPMTGNTANFSDGVSITFN